jgi:hypothetical protein
MARPKRIGPSLAEQIAAVTQGIQVRYTELKGEIDQLSDQYFRLTGQHLNRAGVRRPGRPRAAVAAPVAAAAPGRTKSGKKRIRREGVNLAWLQENLGKQAMTLQQLQGVAQKEGRSALSVMNVLRANKGKFKSQAGEKKAGVKGVPANIYSLKG